MITTQGAQTIANLRSILTLKTAELNELIAQLELTNQAIVNVESTTTQIEHMLKDLGLSGERDESVLMHAEASLDSAIKSASHLYKRRPSMASNGSNGGSTPLVMDQDQQQRREQRMVCFFLCHGNNHYLRFPLLLCHNPVFIVPYSLLDSRQGFATSQIPSPSYVS